VVGAQLLFQSPCERAVRGVAALFLPGEQLPELGGSSCWVVAGGQPRPGDRGVFCRVQDGQVQAGGALASGRCYRVALVVVVRGPQHLDQLGGLPKSQPERRLPGAGRSSV
jgi:hypothetical protein